MVHMVNDGADGALNPINIVVVSASIAADL